MGGPLSDSAGSESEWFEGGESDWLPPLTPTKKLKLFADASVPATMVRELRSAGISVESALDQGLFGADDQAVLGVARKQGKALLTMDSDFWNETKFPVHQVHAIIFVDASPGNIDDALQAFGLLYGCFAKSYPLDWWQGMKARATPQGFILRIRTWEGRNQQYEFRLSGDKRLIAREA